MPDHKGRIESVLEFRGNFFELLIVAAAIGLGINLIAGLVGSALPPLWCAGLSGAIVVIALIVLIVRVRPRVNRKHSIEGLIALESANRRILEIDRYRFSSELSTGFRALFLEQKALEKVWAKTELQPPPSNGQRNDELTSNTLVREAIEYFVVSRLSLDLNSYFVRSRLDPDEIITLQRKDVPSVLLSNRFLDFLSRPMEEREPFSSFPAPRFPDIENNGASVKETLVYAITADGAVFEHFALELPRGTHISRSSGNQLRIETKRFTLNLAVRFDGTNGNLPYDFSELYLGFAFDEVSVYTAWVDVDVQFKLRTLFSRKGWEYFGWIDLFLSNLERDFSFGTFLNTIGWETAYSIATINRQLRQTERRNSKRSK
jgi:hypothetical protein